MAGRHGRLDRSRRLCVRGRERPVSGRERPPPTAGREVGGGPPDHKREHHGVCVCEERKRDPESSEITSNTRPGAQYRARAPSTHPARMACAMSAGPPHAAADVSTDNFSFCITRYTSTPQAEASCHLQVVLSPPLPSFALCVSLTHLLPPSRPPPLSLHVSRL